MTVVFLLIMVMFNGGINTDLTFNTLQQCETVAQQAKKNGVSKAFCIEKQVNTKKKLNCTIENRTDYHNGNSGYNKNLNGYPYPVGISCVEE